MRQTNLICVLMTGAAFEVIRVILASDKSKTQSLQERGRSIVARVRCGPSDPDLVDNGEMLEKRANGFLRIALPPISGIQQIGYVGASLLDRRFNPANVLRA